MPDRRQVFLFAFPGDRDPEFLKEFKSKEAAEKARTGAGPTLVECLLYAGHVGISFSNEGPIFGFKPKCEQGDFAKTLECLKKSEGFPGVVTDDTPIFEEARRRKMDVLCVEYMCTEDEFESIQSRFEQELEESEFVYCFPGGNGDCNCATWPRKLGLRIPESTGVMQRYIAAMRTMASARLRSESEK